MELKERIKNVLKDTPSYKELNKKCPFSVSKIVELCKAEFDEEKVATNTYKKYFNNKDSIYYQKNVEEIIEMWKNKSKQGKTSGVALDDYIGSVLNEDIEQEKNIYTKCTDLKIKSKFDTFKTLYESQFIANGFDFVCREGVLYDDKHKWKGRFDAIFAKNNTIILIDWKNNEKISIDNQYQNMRGSLYRYPSSDLNGYTVQLYLYKYALRKVFGFEDIDIKTIICRIGSGEYEFFAPQIEYSDELVEDILNYSIKELEKKDK